MIRGEENVFMVLGLLQPLSVAMARAGLTSHEELQKMVRRRYSLLAHAMLYASNPASSTKPALTRDGGPPPTL